MTDAQHISIPSGAITGFRLPAGHQPLHTFQFHQVRLQVMSWAISLADTPNFNSIRCDYRYVEGIFKDLSDVISIPSGAITGCKLDLAFDEEDIFQFHQVRLQDHQRTNQSSTEKISIPSGAITGRRAFFFQKGFKLFQFHQVRLQGIRKAKQKAHYFISIPSGAITGRGRCSTKRTGTWISIPSGAITGLFPGCRRL